MIDTVRKWLSRARAAYARRAERASMKQPVDLNAVVPLTDTVVEQVEPVFVLSTGRCGTKWLAALLAESDLAFANHELQPRLIRQGQRAYETLPDRLDHFAEIVRAARDDMISASYQAERIYVETNHFITFLAPALMAAYPRSKFIHLVRHPGDFVRSGMRRNWYGGHTYDVGRIRPSTLEEWEGLSQFERVAWLWNETNAVVEHFFAEDIDPQRTLSVKAEDMFADPDVALGICRFIGAADLTEAHIQRLQSRRVNVQFGGDFPRYEDWTAEQKQTLARWCPLAVQYGYDIG
jgi:hypothetical protein